MYSDAADRGDNDFYRVSTEQDAESANAKEEELTRQQIKKCRSWHIMSKRVCKLIFYITNFIINAFCAWRRFSASSKMQD